MKGIETTVAEGSNGQLLVTVPKQMANFFGIKKGHKIMWHPQGEGIIGEVLL